MSLESIEGNLPSRNDDFRKQTVLLIGQFAELLASHRPILFALDDCIAQAGHGLLASLFSEMKVQVKQGDLMADAMRKHPNLFQARDADIVQFAEEMGLLDKVLRRWADGEDLGSVEDLRRQYATHA